VLCLRGCAFGEVIEGVDIRLVLALGTSEPCYGAEDHDEDDADEEAPAVGGSQYRYVVANCTLGRTRLPF
jgi:hypothetical protein